MIVRRGDWLLLCSRVILPPFGGGRGGGVRVRFRDRGQVRGIAAGQV